MGIKLGERFKKLYHELFGDDALDTALEATIKALETGKEFVELAPVPGLPALFDVIIGILEKVQRTRSNDEAVKGLCVQVKGLCETITRVAETVQKGIDRIPSDSPDRKAVKEKLRASKESSLDTRIDQLKSELEKVLEEAAQLADQPWYDRFFRSKKNMDTIDSLKENIVQACQAFQLQGDITIEMVTQTTLREVTILIERSASYRSGDNAGKAQYLESTRKNVFRELNAWVENSSHVKADHRVLVLVGAAGMGKSTIASELCRQLDESKRLGASFFFTRGPQGPNSALYFFNTIAFQLATLLESDALHHTIVSAVREHLKRGGGSQQQQMEYACEDLVRKPLQTLAESESQHHSPIFIVVDALDECTAEDIDAVPTLLKLLLSCTESPSSPLRILLTSRPEPNSVRHILDAHPSVLRRTFRDIGDQNTVTRDIEAVIRDKLSKHPISLAWSAANPTHIQQLVNRSEGVFVYASTAVEFLRQGDLSDHALNERLAFLLSPDRHMQLPHLENLYLTVLETAFPASTMYKQLANRISLVLEVISVCNTESYTGRQPRSLATLIGIPHEEFMSILRPLGAVIDIVQRDNDPDWEPEFRFMHTTFRDFLLDPEKMKALPRPEFHIDAAQAHATLALGCMRLWLYYAEKYMPELLEESSEMLELRKLEDRDLRRRLRENLQGKKVDEPEHSVEALYGYVYNYCAYHRGLSTSVQSAEMIETAERFDQIPTNLFRAFTSVIYYHV
ncbi:hypothetical protein C8Q76DRAFT_697383 [Earliella scabrosa]|nr:hypothetical protein C8Q76DRAFT_697383 [Earliella scabrosa]